MGGTILRQVVLSCIRKVAEHKAASEPAGKQLSPFLLIPLVRNGALCDGKQGCLHDPTSGSCLDDNEGLWPGVTLFSPKLLFTRVSVTATEMKPERAIIM